MKRLEYCGAALTGVLFVVLSGYPSFAATKADCQRRTDNCMHGCGLSGGSPTTIGHCEYKCDKHRTYCMSTATDRKAAKTVGSGSQTPGSRLSPAAKGVQGVTETHTTRD